MKRLFILLLLMAPLVVSALDNPALYNRSKQSLFGMGARLGWNGYLCDSKFSDPSKLGLSYAIDLTYFYYFNDNWGIRTGANVQFARSGYHVDLLKQTVTNGKVKLTDDLGSSIRTASYTVETRDVNEDFYTIFLEIPAMAAYRHGVFYANAGFKVMLPMYSEADFDYGSINTSITSFPGAGITSFSDPFGVGQDKHAQGTYRLANLAKKETVYPFFLTFSAEMGAHWSLSPNFQLYFGAYFDYSLTSVKVGSNHALVEYTGINTSTGDQEFEFYNALRSDVLSKLRFSDFGVKTQLAFSPGEKERVPEPEPVIEKPQSSAPRLHLLPIHEGPKTCTFDVR